MSAVAGPGLGASLRAKSRGAGFVVLAGLIVLVHLAALAVLFSTEYGPFAITLSLLAWVLLNCFLLTVLQRPGVCAALALALIAILIALSHFKFGILQLTLTFLDFLIIDRDTFSFLLSVFPRLQMQLIVAGLIAAPLLWLVWRFDPFRVRRRLALGGVAASAALIAAMSVISPEQAWEPFQGVNHISNLARSGVVAVSRLASTGWIEADPRRERLPKVVTPGGEQRVEGFALEKVPQYLEQRQQDACRPGPAPCVWQNLRREDYAAWSGLAVQPVIVEQTNDLGDGLLRDWERPEATFVKNEMYALQWYSLAALCVILFIVLSFRREIPS